MKTIILLLIFAVLVAIDLWLEKLQTQVQQVALDLAEIKSNTKPQPPLIHVEYAKAEPTNSLNVLTNMQVLWVR